MRRPAALAGLWLAAAACGGSGAGAPASAPPPSTGGEDLEAPTPVGPDPTNTTAPGEQAAMRDAGPRPDRCVDECVQARQMQATSIEKIRADCADECAARTEDRD